MAYDAKRWIDDGLRRRRRHWGWAILAALAVALIGALRPVAGDDAGAALFPGGLLLLFVLHLSPLSRLFSSSGARLAALDEFDRAVLLAATQRAYAVVAGIILVFAVWLTLGRVFDVPVPNRAVQWEAIFVAMLWVALALPVAFAELMVPLPPAGEAEDAA